MISEITYLISLRDNVDNQVVTGSALYPYFPPTAPALETSYLEPDFITTQDIEKFVGWSINRTSAIPTESKFPETNGFRIKTPGYQDLILFADNQDGSPMVPSEEGAINLGIYNLTRIQANTAVEVASLETVDSDTLVANAPKSEKPRGVDKVSQLIEGKAIDLKKILTTAIVAKISEFGISNIKDLLDDKVNIDELLAKIPKICPTDKKLKEIIAIRNKYAGQLNTFYTNITRLSKTLTGTTTIIEAISIALQATSAARKTANIALGVLPITPGAAPAAINTLKDLEDTIRPKLDSLSKGLGVLSATIAFIAGVLATIIKLLEILDKLILLCAQEQNIPFSEINNELNALNNTLIGNLQNTTANIDNSYKGFRFEILLDTQNNTKYPRRYAVAKDKFNVILLKGQSSFTPNAEVLIDELKFIIDRDNLSAE